MCARRRAARQKDLVSGDARRPRGGNGEDTIPVNRHLTVFVPEINEPKGQMIAWIERGHAVWQVLLTHMALFATSIRIIGTKTNHSPAANCRKRHATGDDQRHPVLKSAPPVVHGGALYYIYPSPSKLQNSKFSIPKISAPRLIFATISAKRNLFFVRGIVPLNGKRGKRHGKIP